jgi:hypothetical protein
MKTYTIKVGFPKEKQIVYPPKIKEIKTLIKYINYRHKKALVPQRLFLITAP